MILRKGDDIIYKGDEKDGNLKISQGSESLIQILKEVYIDANTLFC